MIRSLSLRLLAPTSFLLLVILTLQVSACRSGRAFVAQATDGQGMRSSHHTAPTGPLPEGVTPRLYDVALTLDPNAERFFGEVDIAIEVLEPHRALYMHAQDLKITEVVVKGNDGRPRRATVTPQDVVGLIRLDMTPPLPAGMATLHFSYNAAFSHDLLGLYRTHFEGQGYIFSQLEALHARRVLPCFDEPRFKTPFELTLTVPKDLIATSNGTVMAEQQASGNAGVGMRASLPNGFKRLVFEPTPPLPTYLLAFAVGPFDIASQQLQISPQRPYTLALRGMAPKGHGRSMTPSLKRVAPVLQALEAYTNLPYPFTKLDLVAVPGFSLLGMENAGAITLKDWLVLWGAEDAPYEQRRIYEMVLAHELTHQWFGDWVTMRWWDDLWLNEAFATWRGLRTVRETHPHMQADVELVEGMGNAMARDALATARLVRQPCPTQDDVYNAADVITYQKGAGVLAMFEHFIGPQTMTDGVRAYLRQHPFRTADSTAFVTAISEAARRPELAESMGTFLQQPGVPEIGMSWTCDHRGEAATLTLTQARYSPQGSNMGAGGAWHVPVCVRFGSARGEQTFCHLLREASQEVALSACPRWFVPNAQGVGYYRWHVDTDQRSQVEAALTQGMMSAAESYATLDNLWAQSQSQALPVDHMLALQAKALMSTQPRIVRKGLASLYAAYQRYVTPEMRPRVEAHLGKLVRPAYAQAQKWRQERQAVLLQRSPHSAQGVAAIDDVGEADLLLRDLRAFLSEVGKDRQIRADLAHIGATWLDQVESVRAKDQDVLPKAKGVGPQNEAALADALAMAVDTLGEPFATRLYQALKHSPQPSLRHLIVSGLAQLREPSAAANLRTACLDGRLLGTDVVRVLGGQMKDAALRPLAWDFILAHLDTLSDKLGTAFAARLIGLGENFCTNDAAKQLGTIFAPKIASFAGGQRVLAEAQEVVSLCAADKTAQQQDALAFFGIESTH